MTGQNFAIFDTAIGSCGIVWGPVASTRCSCRWGARRRPAPAFASAATMWREAPPPTEVRRAMDGIVELLEGKPNDLSDVVLDLDGVPEFNRGVYDIARTIPPGKTMTYGDIAKRLGGVELSRDVGQALGRNPCPIVVPCHRRARRRRQARRLLRQWRRGDQAENVGDRRRAGESHAELVRLIGRRAGCSYQSKQRTARHPIVSVGGRSYPVTASQENPSPQRRILPDEGEGKCAVQHSVSVSQ